MEKGTEKYDIEQLQNELHAFDPTLSLRPHQVEGVRFMLKCYLEGHGCILADEMGLGKTCQAISLLVAAVKQERVKQSGLTDAKYLIVCPLSVMNHWKDETARFGQGVLQAISYHGTKEEREELRQKALAVGASWNVMLTTYEILLKDVEFFAEKLNWKIVCVDEAHRIKNKHSQLYQAINVQLQCACYLLLTGTPVQNNLDELYTLLGVVSAAAFPEHQRDAFLQKYRDVSDEKSMSSLRLKLEEFLLRRTKNVVCADLPEKSEVVLYHGLSAVQKRLYTAILGRNHELFDDNLPSAKRQQSLMNVLMQLRKCVNHPYLFEGVEPEPFQEGDHLITSSGKLSVLDVLLTFLQKNGHRVLIFSQMTSMLDILQDYLTFRGYRYERLDGSVRSEERFAAVQKFNTATDKKSRMAEDSEEKPFVFLLSTKAGGLGLTLTGADTVVFVDSDFNPQNDIQAAARAHRIGQNRPVRVVRLVCRHSVEEVVLARAEAKLRLTRAVINDDETADSSDENASSKFTAAELTSVISHGLQKIMISDDDSSTNKEEATNDDIGGVRLDVSNEKLTAILGDTDAENGHWMPINENNKDHLPSSLAANVDESTSIYYFEGNDYKRTEDRDALNALISKQKEQQPITTARSINPPSRSLFQSPPKQQRKKLTDAEKEERQRKKQLTLETKKKKLWHDNGYRSHKLLSDDNDETTVSDDDDVLVTSSNEDDIAQQRINYVIGDVTQPKSISHNAVERPIVLHCVDDSGDWPQRGVFKALSAMDVAPERMYHLASKMGDLSLGDIHLIPISPSEAEKEKANLKVALIVAQRQKKRGDIDVDVLDLAFWQIADYCNSIDNTSVHLPRIGYGLPSVNWYAIERLIRKRFCRKRIPTFVYYYQRRGSTNANGNGTAATVVKKRPLDENKSDEPSCSESKRPLFDPISEGNPADIDDFPSIFDDCTIMILLDSALATDENALRKKRRLERTVCAFDGRVVSTLDELERCQDDVTTTGVTHLLVICHSDTPVFSDTDKKMIGQLNEHPFVLRIEWLQECIKATTLVAVDEYEIDIGL